MNCESESTEQSQEGFITLELKPPPILQGRIPSQAETALMEYAKQTVVKSAETALEFHKTMLGVSATFGTSITTLAPILIWGDKDIKINQGYSWLLLIPSILMMLSSVSFAIGYYPRYSALHPNNLDDVLEARNKVIGQRKFLAAIGLGLFCASLISLIGFVFFLKES